ncbi:hypothetical protein DNTS_000496, partial [Danionella cerebrum]
DFTMKTVVFLSNNKKKPGQYSDVTRSDLGSVLAPSGIGSLHCSDAVNKPRILSAVSAIEIFSPVELFVENGTTATLTCSFKSKEAVSSATSVTWSFQPDGENTQQTVILYHLGGTSYPGSLAQFNVRVEWAGDMNKRDASIRVLQMQFKDNGTFSCDVKNPPDITGQSSHTRVLVIVGGVIGAVIGIILISVVTYLIIRRQEPQHDYE